MGKRLIELNWMIIWRGTEWVVFSTYLDTNCAY